MGEGVGNNQNKFDQGFGIDKQIVQGISAQNICNLFNYFLNIRARRKLPTLPPLPGLKYLMVYI